VGKQTEIILKCLALLFIASASSAARSEDLGPKPAQFFDVPAYVEGQPTPGYAAHIYADAPGEVKRRLFVFSPDGGSRRARPAVLLFHSGGFTRGRPEWLFGLARQFAAKGLVGIPVQYRLSRGGLTAVDAFADACKAFQWVRSHANELNVDPNRLVGWGASAGGYLVAATATMGCDTSKADLGGANSLILESAVVNFTESAQFRSLFGATPDPRAYSPLAHISRSTPPTLHIVGLEDSNASPAEADAYCARMREVRGRCKVVAYPGVGHLLTRKIDDQRSSLDPDPELEAAAYQEQERFLRSLSYLR